MPVCCYSPVQAVMATLQTPCGRSAFRLVALFISAHAIKVAICLQDVDGLALVQKATTAMLAVVDVTGYNSTDNVCLQWRMKGRIGNQIAGLTNTIYKAEVCDYPCIYSTPLQQAKLGFFDINDTLHLKSNHAAVNEEACRHQEKRLKHLHGVIADFPRWNETKKIIARQLFPLLRGKKKFEKLRETVDDKDLVVLHLRGSDAFQGQDLAYMPPPCRYWDDIIKTGNGGGPFLRVNVVTDDPCNHPCLDYLRARHPELIPPAPPADAQHNPMPCKQGRVPEDEALFKIMGARNLALSTSSTFGIAGFLLNPNRDMRLFMPVFTPDKVEGPVVPFEGTYKAESFACLCSSAGIGSTMYEMTPPYAGGWLDKKTRKGEYNSRTEWVLDDRSMDGSVVHRCGP